MASRFVLFASSITLSIFVYPVWTKAIKERSEYATKTIKAENGDTYNCVDFYKQPAFNHPLLENHSFYPEMMPSWRPRRTRSDAITKNKGRLTDIIKLKGVRCPKGTVPIRRIDNQDHLLQVHTELSQQYYTKFAIGQSKSDPTKAYYGIGASLSVFNPQTQPSQYSSGEIMIRGGSDVIIVGWTVNPIVYKDNQTRFFIYAIAGESHCFNSACGFVIVRSDIPLDFIMKPISKIEGPIYEMQFFVYQDEKNGNWWLEVGEDNIILGFWPQKIFKGLAQSGDYIACGGEAYGPSDLGRPNMGTGFYPFSKFKEYNSYCRDIEVVDQAHNVVYYDDIETFSNDEHGYGVFKVDDRMVIYGGPDTY